MFLYLYFYSFFNVNEINVNIPNFCAPVYMCVYICVCIYIGSKVEPTVAEEVLAEKHRMICVSSYTPQVAPELSVDVDVQQASPEECFDFALPISYERSVNNCPLPICDFPHELYSSVFEKGFQKVLIPAIE